MIEVEGVHQKIRYAATYQIVGDETMWRATFFRGDETFEREGRILHGWMVQADAHNQVQVAIQLYIEYFLLNEAFDLAERREELRNGQVVPGTVT